MVLIFAAADLSAKNREILHHAKISHYTVSVSPSNAESQHQPCAH